MKNIVLLLTILFVTTSVGFSYYIHYLHNDKIPELKETSFSQGKIHGDSIGFSRGHLKGALDVKTSVILALNGSEYIFIDEKMKSHIPYQSIVNNIFDEKKPIEESIDSMYLGMIESLADFISLNKTERGTLKYKYNYQKTKMINVFKSNYNQELRLQNLQYTDKDYEKVKAYTDVMTNLICSIIDLLPVPQRTLLFNNSIAKGRVSSPRALNQRVVDKHKKNKDSFLEDQIKDQITGTICSNIISNSIEFLVGAFMDYAKVKSFSEYLVIGDIQNTTARKMITAESLVPVYMGEKFRGSRWWGQTAVDFSADAHIFAGVNLEKKFNVEMVPTIFSGSNKTQIIVTLPEPEIMSVDIESEFDVVNGYWYKRLEDKEINYINKAAKDEGRKNAINAGILDQAKREAEKAFKEMYYPIIDQAVGNYEILVEFEEDEFLN